MKKIKLLLVFLTLPLVVSGCFKFSRNTQILDPKYLVFNNQTLAEAAYQVRYPEKWDLSEDSTGAMGTSTDVAVFKVSREQKISATVYQGVAESEVLAMFQAESQSQTEVNRLLGSRLISAGPDNDTPVEAIVVKNGDYVYVFQTTVPHSPEFVDFLNNVTIFNNLNSVAEPPAAEVKQPIYKLYFGREGANLDSCTVSYYREVYFNRPDDEIELIPKVIQTLLSPEQLRLDELGLFTGIPAGTRLLSFGYDNNKAIVNFSAHLNLGGGSCAMTMRRDQIEKTLMALNEVSNLKIMQVEIQVDGSTDEVLQP